MESNRGLWRSAFSVFFLNSDSCFFNFKFLKNDSFLTIYPNSHINCNRNHCWWFLCNLNPSYLYLFISFKILLAAIDCGRPIHYPNQPLISGPSGNSSVYDSRMVYTCLDGYWFQRDVFVYVSRCTQFGYWQREELECIGTVHLFYSWME